MKAITLCALSLSLKWFFCSESEAADIDAVAFLNSALASKPFVQYAFCHEPGKHDPICDTKVKIERDFEFATRRTNPEVIIVDPGPSVGPAVVSNSRIVEVQALKFEDAKITSLPEVLLYAHKTIMNCADVSVTSAVSLSVSGTKSWSVAKTDGVSTTMSASVSGSYGSPPTGSAGMTLTWSQTISSSIAKTEGGSTQIQRSFSDNVTTGPHKAIDVKIKAFQNSIEIPYSAVVVVDGDLFPNLGNLTVASNLLSPAERTLPIRGSLFLTDVSEEQYRADDLIGAAGCGDSNAKIYFAPQISIPAQGQAKFLSEDFSVVGDKVSRHTTSAEDLVTQRDQRPLDDSTITSPDGTSYQVLYITEVARQTPACGFNDAGVANTGLFKSEAREYTTFANGMLVSKWQETVESFKECLTI